MALYLILILRESENHLYFRFRDMLEHLDPQDLREKLVHEYVIEKNVINNNTAKPAVLPLSLPTKFQVSQNFEFRFA